MNRDTALTESAVYRGWVRHRRFVPKPHAFRYQIFMFYLNLDHLEEALTAHWFVSLERRNVVSFRREDYFAGQSQNPARLKDAVIAAVQDWYGERALARPDITSVCVLTQLRLFGFLFNPVSFYYCFDAQAQLVAILAEITNTPWGERHAYVLPIAQSSPDMQYRPRGLHHHGFSFDKAFHVSPFNPMNMHYQWQFSAPEQALRIHMDNLVQAPNSEIEKHFDATLCLQRLPLRENLAATVIRFPGMTVKTVAGIYWQALKLKLKGMPFYSHPNSQSKTSANAPGEST